jgi:peroxiredoxin
MTRGDTLGIGTAAPDFTLPDQTGNLVRLSSLWQQNPLVLVFARHLGCPFCREHLLELQRDFQKYDNAGAELAAVTMSPPADTIVFRDRFQLTYRILSDVEQVAYRGYQVRRGSMGTVAGPQLWWKGLKSFLAFGTGKIAGDPFQLPGSFVISPQGRVMFAHFATDSADWASTADHLQSLALASGAATPQTRG